MVELEEGTPVKASRKKWWLIPVVAVLGAVATMGIIALLLNIAEKKQEANSPYFQVVQLTDTTVDPAVWGQNFPIQYAAFQRTAEMPDDEKVARTPTADDPREFTALSKLEADPRLVTMWQGYAFSVD
ncbi:MAG TPA: ammonia-forming cytochrome c nitrite reductase subunit c552, partial [Propionibacteriaceae bacterium]|nr:ammonia-forming cytochrome c nitrite reductase subunit c552 [Propionibacteriaceae bacterium]